MCVRSWNESDREHKGDSHSYVYEDIHAALFICDDLLNAGNIKKEKHTVYKHTYLCLHCHHGTLSVHPSSRPTKCFVCAHWIYLLVGFCCNKSQADFKPTQPLRHIHCTTLSVVTANPYVSHTHARGKISLFKSHKKSTSEYEHYDRVQMEWIVPTESAAQTMTYSEKYTQDASNLSSLYLLIWKLFIGLLPLNKINKNERLDEFIKNYFGKSDTEHSFSLVLRPSRSFDRLLCRKWIN